MADRQKYNKENADFFKAFLEKTFFYNFRNSNREKTVLHNYNSIELALGYACDLDCTYCYYKRYGKELYHNKPVTKKDVLKNVEKIMNFIVKNNMYVDIDLFSGESFMIPYIWEIMDIIYTYEKKLDPAKRTEGVFIPTNMSFLKDQRQNILKNFEHYRKKFSELDIELGVSASIDGPFMDNENRAHKDETNYTETFYGNLLDNKEKFSYGFHPMVYSNNIEYWIDNFLWFIENVDKGLYLLEVRNAEWNEKQVKSFYYLIKFIIHYMFKAFDMKEDGFLHFIQNTQIFNLSSNVFSTTGRGLGCSLQSVLQIQLNDLTINPCHRLSYDYLSAGKLELDKDGTYDFIPNNVEFYIATNSVSSRSMSPCHSCPINEICSAACLGSNLESTGDPFVNSPTVCRMLYAKSLAIVESIQEIGLINYFLDTLDNGDPLQMRKASQIKLLLEEGESV